MPLLALYICYLYQDPNINSANTIRQYISGGPRVHQERLGLQWPSLRDQHVAAAALKAAKTFLADGTNTNRKAGITVGILNNFRLCLGARLHTEQGACLWAAFLTAFFGLLRKANVACVTQGQHPDSARQDSYPADFRQPPARLAPVVRRQDLERRPDGSYMLTLPCTKTRQPGSGRRTTAKNSFAAHHQRAPRHSVGGSGNARTMPGAGAGHVRRPDPGPAAERAVVRLAGCPDRHLEAPHLCSPSDRDEGAIATVRRRPDPIRGPIVPARRRILWRTTQPDSQLCTSRRWGIGSVTRSRSTLRRTRASGK